MDELLRSPQPDVKKPSGPAKSALRSTAHTALSGKQRRSANFCPPHFPKRMSGLIQPLESLLCMATQPFVVSPPGLCPKATRRTTAQFSDCGVRSELEGNADPEVGASSRDDHGCNPR